MTVRNSTDRPSSGAPSSGAPAAASAAAPGPRSLLWQGLKPIDRQFAFFLERLGGKPDPTLVLAAALVSHSRGEGHLCLDLTRVGGAGAEAGPAAGLLAEAAGESSAPLARAVVEELPSPAAWQQALRESAVVGRPGEFKPLILDGHGRLYLHRYWTAEATLARAILDRARPEAAVALEPAWGGPPDTGLLEEGLRRLFPAHRAATPDPQALAARLALLQALAVISGGPGTGKTRTVAALLALALEQAEKHGVLDRVRIALAAPTGKAAARLQESIQALKPTLACAGAIRDRLPTEAFTLHRLLGFMPDSGAFRHHAANPLPFDLVVVDEASMVDLPLLAQLFAATAPGTRLLLLGDPDQLASVEAGAVLGDICEGTGGPEPLARCLIRLEKNYRFGPNDGLLTLSRAVRAGDAGRALATLQAGRNDGVLARPLPPAPRLSAALKPWVLAHFAEMVQARDPLTALQALARSRILAAIRQGPFGVERLNDAAENLLAEAGLIDPEDRWYAGRPILITRNDYQLGLFNGDIGILLPAPAAGPATAPSPSTSALLASPREEAGASGDPGESVATPGDPERRRTRRVMAWFLGGDGTLRRFAPARLPEHETVFAMTVHKSQGSEFDEVLLVLPDRLSPVLTRELIYTGTTRARQRLEAWFEESVFRGAVQRQAFRASGLRAALWGEKVEAGPGPGGAT